MLDKEEIIEVEVKESEEYIINRYHKAPKHTNRKVPKKFTIMLVTGCMLGSGFCAFGGTYLANSLNGYATEDVLYDSDNSARYQPVKNTATSRDGTSELSVADVAATVGDSVVEITTEVVSTNGRMHQLISEGAGSGVIVTTDGYIVTNHHVIADAQSIRVRLSDGSEYEAKLVGTDAKTDLAVLKIEETGLQAAVLGTSTDLVVGQSAVAVGNPLGELGGTVTQGIISALDRAVTIDGETMSLLQTDTAINPGNSGGGLFNLYGELIGIVNAKSSGSDIEGLGFAIPIDTVKEIIEELMEHGYVTGRVDTGFTLLDIQDQETAMSYRVNQYGLYISKSENSDFKSGDIMVAIDGQTVSSYTDYTSILDDYEIGDTIDITVLRSRQTITISLTLTEKQG